MLKTKKLKSLFISLNGLFLYNEITKRLEIINLTLLNFRLSTFFPEPHLLGKLRWIAGGAVGMAFKDWLDVVFHGFPFVLLIRLLFIKLTKKNAA